MLQYKHKLNRVKIYESQLLGINMHHLSKAAEHGFFTLNVQILFNEVIAF